MKTTKIKIQDRVKTFEEAHAIFQEKKFTDALFLKLQKRQIEDMTSMDMMLIICEVLREEWVPDYNNTNQLKWSCWSNKKSSGWVFGASDCDGTGTNTSVGPRFALPTEELAEYFHTQFNSIINDYLTIL